MHHEGENQYMLKIILKCKLPDCYTDPLALTSSVTNLGVVSRSEKTPKGQKLTYEVQFHFKGLGLVHTSSCACVRWCILCTHAAMKQCIAMFTFLPFCKLPNTTFNSMLPCTITRCVKIHPMYGVNRVHRKQPFYVFLHGVHVDQSRSTDTVCVSL